MLTESLTKQKSQERKLKDAIEKKISIIHHRISYMSVGISLLSFSVLLAIRLDHPNAYSWTVTFAPLAIFDIWWIGFHLLAVLAPQKSRENFSQLPRFISDYYCTYNSFHGSACFQTCYALLCITSMFSGVATTIFIPAHLDYHIISLQTAALPFILFSILFSSFTFPMVANSWSTRSYCPGFGISVWAVSPIIFSVIISMIIYLANVRYYVFILIPAFIVDGSLFVMACMLCCMSLRCAHCSVILSIVIPVVLFQGLLCGKLVFNQFSFVKAFIPLWIGALLIAVGSYIWIKLDFDSDN